LESNELLVVALALNKVKEHLVFAALMRAMYSCQTFAEFFHDDQNKLEVNQDRHRFNHLKKLCFDA
jgi:hypothetical protein